MSEHLEADRRVAAVIESGVVFGLFDRALDRVWRSGSTSATVAMATGVANAWTGLGVRVRRVAVGTMLVVAVAAHIVFTLLTQVPPGWIWLVLPGIFGAIGLLLVALPGLAGVTKR
ncbi:MAG: hypothetical protein Q8O42_01770 [Acidobacteriota bacterium]|nr:hypothetical protein [Acidobacteriota bacterium]